MSDAAITLPDPLRQSAEKQVASRGVRDVGEYVGRLIERDVQRQAELDQLEAQLLEGLKGDPIEATDDWWDELEKRLDERYPPPSLA